jgi:superfamily II DNA or RNA helicase
MTPRSYQIPSVERLCQILPRFGSAIDGSDTGVGKTFVAAFTAKALGWPVAVVCPKAVIPSWELALEQGGVRTIFVQNVERLRANKKYLVEGEKKNWVWRLPERCLLIFDECHRFSGEDTANAWMLKAAPKPVLMLSATCADSPIKLRAIGHQLGLVHWDEWYMWCFRNGCVKNVPFGGLKFVGGDDVLERLHQQVFEERGVRIRISELGDAFPDNTVEAVPIAVDESQALDADYLEALELLEAEAPNAAVVLLRARQKSEFLKVQAIFEMANDLLAENNHVAIFVCFRDTLDRLAEKFPNASLVYGEQDAEERRQAIELFQSNHNRVIISTIQAGGVGISLHDLQGNAPRVSLICPTYSAVDLKQALGRIHRNGAKTPCLQRILFAAGTVEERVRRKVQKKIDRINTLNDGDLSPYENTTHPHPTPEMPDPTQARSD